MKDIHPDVLFFILFFAGLARADGKRRRQPTFPLTRFEKGGILDKYKGFDGGGAPELREEMPDVPAALRPMSVERSKFRWNHG